MSSLMLVGANHIVAPIEIREKLAVPKGYLPEALQRLTSSPGVREGYILSTCNRTEIYTVGEPGACRKAIHGLLSDLQGVSMEELRLCLYEKRDEDVAMHLFSVAAGIDSMILGEVQILAQIKESFAVASELNAVGKRLDTLLRKALEASKRARTETGISARAASVSHVAVELARKIFGDITESVVLVIGAGKMGELVARNLVDNGARGIVFVNRTYQKGINLAERFSGVAATFDDLPEQLKGVDVVISSTDAPHYVVHYATVQKAMATRQGRPLFLIDLAVPRDIEPTIQHLPGIHLYDIDDIQSVVQENMGERINEVTRVREILAEEVAKFMSWYNSLVVAPTIKALRKRAEEIRISELSRANGKLSSLTEEQLRAVHALTQAIVNKMLHHPTANLKTAAVEGKGQEYAEALERLFELRLE